MVGCHSLGNSCLRLDKTEAAHSEISLKESTFDTLLSLLPGRMVPQCGNPNLKAELLFEFGEIIILLHKYLNCICHIDYKVLSISIEIRVIDSVFLKKSVTRKTMLTQFKVHHRHHSHRH